MGDSAGNGITTIDNNIVIGHLFDVRSVFRQVSDRCFIDNIYGVPISILTSTPVLVDSDGIPSAWQAARRLQLQTKQT